MKTQVMFLLLCASSLFAQTKEFVDDSGNAFLRLCSAIDKEDKTSTEWAHVMACTGFVTGFTRGVEFGSLYVEDKAHKKVPHLFCTPSEIENGQIIRIVLKYIRDNPAEAHLPTGALVVDALQKAFPCPDK